MAEQDSIMNNFSISQAQPTSEVEKVEQENRLTTLKVERKQEYDHKGRRAFVIKHQSFAKSASEQQVKQYELSGSAKILKTALDNAEEQALEEARQLKKRITEAMENHEEAPKPDAIALQRAKVARKRFALNPSSDDGSKKKTVLVTSESSAPGKSSKVSFEDKSGQGKQTSNVVEFESSQTAGNGGEGATQAPRTETDEHHKAAESQNADSEEHKKRIARARAEQTERAKRVAHQAAQAAQSDQQDEPIESDATHAPDTPDKDPTPPATTTTLIPSPSEAARQADLQANPPRIPTVLDAPMQTEKLLPTTPANNKNAVPNRFLKELAETLRTLNDLSEAISFAAKPQTPSQSSTAVSPRATAEEGEEGAEGIATTPARSPEQERVEAQNHRLGAAVHIVAHLSQSLHRATHLVSTIAQRVATTNDPAALETVAPYLDEFTATLQKAGTSLRAMESDRADTKRVAAPEQSREAPASAEQFRKIAERLTVDVMELRKSQGPPPPDAVIQLLF